jgi:hypothetical protein
MPETGWSSCDTKVKELAGQAIDALADPRASSDIPIFPNVSWNI